MPSVYLAGPDVFLPDARAVAEEKKALCRRHGLEPLHPLDGASTLEAAPIFAGNHAFLLSADAVIADLTPFRGPSADVGTVWEIGFAAGRGIPVFGFAATPMLYPARAQLLAPFRDPGAPGAWAFDPTHEIEDFGLPDNLMIVVGAALHGGAFITGPESDDPFRSLDLFAQAVTLAAARLVV